ncbi:MAG: hypothetical protein N2645_02390 [Clostridia bacterium]|nr:hypothetical protein [Clostridia bacterium]
MDKFNLLYFLIVSVPEAFIVATFVWLILGKKQNIGFKNVIMVGAISASSSFTINIIFYPYLEITALVQAVAFTFILYFMYKLRFSQAVIGSIISYLVVAAIQMTIVSVGYLINGENYEELHPLSYLKILYPYIEFVVLGVISFILYKKNLKIFNFNNKNIDNFNYQKVRYTVLQMIFALVIVLINFKIFYVNIENFKTYMDKAALAINFLVIIVFTLIVIRSAFKMSTSIQREEEMKRELDGKEFIQNIDYICCLMETKNYSEVMSILNSIKKEVR